MFTQIFEWGKSEICHTARSQIEDRIVNIAATYDSYYDSVDQVLQDSGGYMDDKDFEFLSEHQESAHPLHAPTDFDVKVSERVLCLERAHYFLGSTDSDYHLPLLVTMREEATKNGGRGHQADGNTLLISSRKSAEKVQERRKGGKKGKGRVKEQYRASDQTQQYRASDQAPKGQGKAPKQWNQPGQKRSVFETPDYETPEYGTVEYDWLQAGWLDNSQSRGQSSSWWSSGW